MTGAGAWAGADVDEGAIDLVVKAFRTKGTKAGLRVAKSHGTSIFRGAQVYLDYRASTEEALAAEVAARQARVVKGQDRDVASLAFLEKRLVTVRNAVAAGRTPPQAVVDRPEIPRREVPRWLSFVAIGLSVIAFVRSSGHKQPQHTERS